MVKKSFFARHKKLWIILTIVLILVVWMGSCVAKAMKQSAEMLANMSKRETAVVERRDINDVVATTGSVVSKESKLISAEVNNVKVESVSVKVGDHVNAGDVICILDATDLQAELDNANKEYSVSKKTNNLSMNSAKKELKEAKESKERTITRQDETVAKVKKEYDNAVENTKKAKNTYEDAKRKTWETENALAETRQKLAELEALITVSGSVSGSDADVAAMTDEEKQALYNQLKESEGSLQQALEQFGQAESLALTEYNAAAVTEDKCKEAYETSIQTKDDTIRTQDSSIDKLQEGVTKSELSASVGDYKTLSGIESLEEQIANCVVTAPISGIVTELKVEPGDRYTGTPIALIEDVTAYEISTAVDEYSISKVEVGQKAVVKTNGTGDDVLEGVVKEVSPKAVEGQGDVYYRVTIELLTKEDRLRLDMTAKISIVVGGAENVLVVPYDAVFEDEDGRFYVEVKDENAAVSADAVKNNGGLPLDQTKKIYVTKGTESSFYTEIIGDEIKEGMEVLLPKTQANDFMQMLQEEMGGM